MPLECDFGALRKIMLPPNALTIPRTELPMKQLLNIQGAHLEGFNQQRISFFSFFFSTDLLNLFCSLHLDF